MQNTESQGAVFNITNNTLLPGQTPFWGIP